MVEDHAALRVCRSRVQNLPLFAARRLGYFDEARLEVTLSFTNSSAQQLSALATGEYDLIHTAPDNVVNFDTNPAGFGLDPATAPRVVMLMGGSNGPLGVYARQGSRMRRRCAGRALGWIIRPRASRSSCATCSPALAWSWDTTTASPPRAARASARRGCSRASSRPPSSTPPSICWSRRRAAICSRAPATAYPAYASQALWRPAVGRRQAISSHATPARGCVRSLDL